MLDDRCSRHPRMYVRDLRQVTLFAGTLTAAERTRVYGDFSHSEGAANRSRL